MQYLESSTNRLVYRRIFTDERYIHPGIFIGRALSKQQSVCVEELSADSCPRKFDVLKTNICQGSEASRANMLVLRTSSFQGATIRSIVPRHKSSIVLKCHYGQILDIHFLHFRTQ